jgi:hypothetical protein
VSWQDENMKINEVTVLNRCQEFTFFVRRNSLKNFRYNEKLGVGANTLWGAEEGPDFLIRLIQSGCKIVFYPNLFVYHPNKISVIDAKTLERAASYARGRGCLFRIHKFPLAMILNGLFRPTVGCILYFLKFQPLRARYYFAIVKGILRGLFMSKSEIDSVSNESKNKSLTDLKSSLRIGG